MNLPRVPLLLTFFIGLSGNASLAALTIEQVNFSIFPFIACGLAAYQFYMVYLKTPIEGLLSKASLASFLLGACGYSAILRVQHPEIGSNFLLLMVCLGLIMWLAYKLEWFSVK
ncbi:DUF1422 family protein [Alginatibacterium sediminis]|uniref:DUF1422 family protein n=1 Tax=Alginatibacterium sediminis TaxID=2164068 RepID=A0A420E5I8_9ALTE|nr:DUF1422 family protein [Alginatibacterium sediminis]RKF13112.1 DUF1422 family protein [Alginatibacterium sediminis]